LAVAAFDAVRPPRDIERPPTSVSLDLASLSFDEGGGTAVKPGCARVEIGA
jgi:hypothetical protein